MMEVPAVRIDWEREMIYCWESKISMKIHWLWHATIYWIFRYLVLLTFFMKTEDRRSCFTKNVMKNN